MKTLGLMFTVVATLLATGAGFAQAASATTNAQYYSSHAGAPGNGSPNKVDGGR